MVSSHRAMYGQNGNTTNQLTATSKENNIFLSSSSQKNDRKQKNCFDYDLTPHSSSCLERMLTIDDDINCNIFINNTNVDSPRSSSSIDDQDRINSNSNFSSIDDDYDGRLPHSTTTSASFSNDCNNANLGTKTGGVGAANGCLVKSTCGAKIRARSADYYPNYTPQEHHPNKVVENDCNVADDASNDRSTSSETAMPNLAPVPSCVALKGAILALYRLDDFDLQKIGQGFFSEVYKVRHKVNGDEMVLKSNIMSSNRPNVLKEVQLMRRLKHPNVLRFKGVCVDKGQLHALTEYCNGGSLDQFIKNKEQNIFPWSMRASLSLDIARGMQYVHSCEYIHRDLTSKNVLLKGDGFRLRAVIADFGLACKIPKPGGPKLEAVGTPYWMGPECLNDELYNEKADVFSYGIILCEIIARIDADPDVMPRTAIFGLDYLRYSELCPSDTPVDLLKLSFQCCQMDPNNRPSFEQIVPMALSVLKLLQHFGVRRTVDSSPPTTTTSPGANRTLTKPKTPSTSCKLIRSNSDVTMELLAVYLNQSEARANFAVSGSLTNASRTNPTSPAAASVLSSKRKLPSSDANRAVAHSIAAEDPLYQPSFDGDNPFANHTKFAGGRKIVADNYFNRTVSVLRNGDDDDDDAADGVERMFGGLLPRCNNLGTPVRRANSLPGSPMVHSSWLKQWHQQRQLVKNDNADEPCSPFDVSPTNRKNDSESRRRMSNVFVKIDRRFIESKSSLKKQPIKRSATVSDAYTDDDDDIDSIHLYTYDEFRLPVPSPSHPSPVAEEETMSPSSDVKIQSPSTIPSKNETVIDEDVFDDSVKNDSRKCSSTKFDDIQLNNVVDLANDSKIVNHWKNDIDDGDRSPDSLESTSCAGPWQTKCQIL